MPPNGLPHYFSVRSTYASTRPPYVEIDPCRLECAPADLHAAMAAPDMDAFKGVWNTLQSCPRCNGTVFAFSRIVRSSVGLDGDEGFRAAHIDREVQCDCALVALCQLLTIATYLCCSNSGHHEVKHEWHSSFDGATLPPCAGLCTRHWRRAIQLFWRVRRCRQRCIGRPGGTAYCLVPLPFLGAQRYCVSCHAEYWLCRCCDVSHQWAEDATSKMQSA